EERQKVQLEASRGGENVQAGIRRAAGHVGGDCEVGVLLALVTPNLPRVQFAAGQLIIQQHARARSTIQIDELDIDTREIHEAGDSTRIVSWKDKPLDSSGELNE